MLNSSNAQMTSPIGASTELPIDEAGGDLSTPLQANAPPFVPGALAASIPVGEQGVFQVALPPEP